MADQKRIIQMIPGLEEVEIVRYGVMHRNTYLRSPGVLNAYYQSIEHPHIFFAGQVTGVEGYVESASSGLYAALSMVQYLEGKDIEALSPETMMGALAHYIANANPNNFQPMNINFGIVTNRSKDREMMAERSLNEVKTYARKVA